MPFDVSSLTTGGSKDSTVKTKSTKPPADRVETSTASTTTAVADPVTAPKKTPESSSTSVGLKGIPSSGSSGLDDFFSPDSSSSATSGSSSTGASSAASGASGSSASAATSSTTSSSATTPANGSNAKKAGLGKINLTVAQKKRARVQVFVEMDSGDYPNYADKEAWQRVCDATGIPRKSWGKVLEVARRELQANGLPKKKAKPGQFRAAFFKARSDACKTKRSLTPGTSTTVVPPVSNERSLQTGVSFLRVIILTLLGMLFGAGIVYFCF